MTGLFGWLSELFTWLGAWIPRLLVLKSSEAGVKYVHGWKPVRLGPGLHVYWPVVTLIERTSVVNQVLDLSEQKLVTADDKTVLVSGLVSYTIVDVMAFLAENENSFQVIDNVATAAIEDVITTTTYDELRTGRKKLRAKLKRACKRELKGYGVAVSSVRLTDFAPARVLCLSGVQMVQVNQGASE